MILLRLPLLLVVLFCQSFFLALGQIWANKVRSLLTMTGIVIGVASVTAVIAALTGLKQNVLSEFEAFGTNKLFVLPSRPEGPKGRQLSRRWIDLTPGLFDDVLEHCPSLKAFTRVTVTSQSISAGSRTEEAVRITGIEPAWHEVERRGVIQGRPFSMIDNEQARPVCLIDERLRDKLQLDRDCTGQSIMIGPRRYTIVGLVESRTESGMFGGNSSDAEVFVPFRVIYQASDHPWMHVVATSRSPELAEDAQGEITFFLRKARRLRLEDANTFRIEFVQRFVDEFTKVAIIITTVATGIVAISLLVGGVGIMNIMLVSVSERTREIGLRKAVGAPPAAILLQFLVEAVAICFIGGLIGLGVAHLLTWGLSSIPGAHLDKASIPTWAVLLAFGFAGTVGLTFGMFPAIKAARLNPIDALRHE